MNIKMHQAVLAYQTCLAFKKEKMPLKTAYKFNRLIDRLEEEVIFYNQKLDEAVKNYAELNEDGSPVFMDDTTVKIREDKVEECQKVMGELEDLDIEVNAILFELEELEHLSISIEEVNNLIPFIKE